MHKNTYTNNSNESKNKIWNVQCYILKTRTQTHTVDERPAEIQIWSFQANGSSISHQSIHEWIFSSSMKKPALKWQRRRRVLRFPHAAQSPAFSRKNEKQSERERGRDGSICLHDLPGAHYPNPRNPGCELVACATSQDTSVLPPS